MNLLYELGVGLLLGFSLAVPPGPMNALIAAQSVRSRARGTLTGAGAMSADAVLAAVVFLVSTILTLDVVLRPIYALGCGVMGYFGYRLLVAGSRPTAPEAGTVRTFTTGLAVGLSNPFQILWWLTAGLAFAYLGGLALFVGLFGAIAVWIVVFPIGISAGAERSLRFERGVTYASGAIMVGFAAYFAYLAVV
jgi:threonine/homoserine/homoserine lactone efflux protein